MHNFLAQYPDYGKSTRKLTLSGESYAGKYVPYFASRILDDNTFALTNLIIGNPYTSPVNQRTSTHLVGTALGIVDPYNMDQIAALRRQCEEAVSSNMATAGEECTATLDYVLAVGGGVFDKDARLFSYDYLAGAFKKPY